MATNIVIGPININSTYRLRSTITKDGVAWSGIDSVTYVFERPNGTQFSRSCTLEDDAAGVWYYDTTVTNDVNTAGQWYLTPAVVDGSVQTRYPRIVTFTAVDNP